MLVYFIWWFYLLKLKFLNWEFFLTFLFIVHWLIYYLSIFLIFKLLLFWDILLWAWTSAVQIYVIHPNVWLNATIFIAYCLNHREMQNSSAIFKSTTISCTYKCTTRTNTYSYCRSSGTIGHYNRIWCCSTFPRFFLLHRQQLQLTGLISFYLYKKKKNHDLALSNFLELGK